MTIFKIKADIDIAYNNFNSIKADYPANKIGQLSYLISLLDKQLCLSPTYWDIKELLEDIQYEINKFIP